MAQQPGCYVWSRAVPTNRGQICSIHSSHFGFELRYRFGNPWPPKPWSRCFFLFAANSGSLDYLHNMAMDGKHLELTKYIRLTTACLGVLWELYHSLLGEHHQPCRPHTNKNLRRWGAAPVPGTSVQPPVWWNVGETGWRNCCIWVRWPMIYQIRRTSWRRPTRCFQLRSFVGGFQGVVVYTNTGYASM